MHGIILLSDLNYTYSDPPFLHSQITGFNWAPITISSIYPLFLLSLALIPRPLWTWEKSPFIDEGFVGTPFVDPLWTPQSSFIHGREREVGGSFSPRPTGQVVTSRPHYSVLMSPLEGPFEDALFLMEQGTRTCCFSTEQHGCYRC